MLENYLIKGLIIGIVFGVPAGAVGVLSIQRAITHGTLAGLMTGIGSSVADVFYACVGVFGITMISDFLLRHQRFICMIGCLLVIVIGIRTLRIKQETRNHYTESTKNFFLSSFAIAITNPAAVVSFMIVFSLFHIGGNESMGENIQLVFGIFCGTIVWWLGIAVTVSRLRDRITGDYYLKLNRIFGILMVLFGTVIGIRGIFP